jgi:hypothetical protein
MMKQFLRGMAICTALLVLWGTAKAAEISINIYGASAQYLFWNDAADDFLTQSMKCTNTERAGDSTGSHGITKGTGCSGKFDTIYIRYSSKASYDGIRAMCGVDPDNQCPDKRYRKMVDETSCPGGAKGAWKDGTCSALKCVDVTLGAADAAGESFVQESHGNQLGHKGGNWEDDSFNGIPTCGQDKTLAYYRPVVVPFAFFANNSVTVKRCVAPSATEGTGIKVISKAGDFCTGDDNGHDQKCIGYYKCDGTCTGGVKAGQKCSTATDCPDATLNQTSCKEMPLDNISRLMAAMIFSGQAYYWSDFGGFFKEEPIVACLRHAGSGTHATLDASVMKGAAGLPTVQSHSEPTVWFNKGSGDMMKCIDENRGAIGYADADQLADRKNYPNVHALNYQGVEPRRWTVRNGLYDFWSAQWVYEDPQESNYNDTHPVVQALMAFASNPAKIPATKADYWATQSEMNYTKGTDWLYPEFTGASNPQTP